MRCQFCGWDNPEEKVNCEKCNKPLTASDKSMLSSAQGAQHRPTRMMSQEMPPRSLKATVPEGAMGRNLKAEQNVCPECGYPMEDSVCPQCGYHIPGGGKTGSRVKTVHEHALAEGKKTVRPKRKGEKEGRFILTPISEETGQPEGDLLEYEGNEIVLNRDNTDPKNTTITSHEQAVVFFENGQWGIEDRSELKTSFVQASRRIELKKGDIILLGNQLYRFDDISYQDI